MRLFQRMCRDNSLVRPRVGSSTDSAKRKYTADYRADIVHSSNYVHGAPEPALDVALIEAQARDARLAWVGSKLKPYYEALVRKFARGGNAEMENYLAASQNLADLEERIRHFERVQSRCH